MTSLPLFHINAPAYSMLGSIAVAMALGVVGTWSYEIAVVLLLAYGFVVWLDSSSLTAGAAGTALAEVTATLQQMDLRPSLRHGSAFRSPSSASRSRVPAMSLPRAVSKI